MSGPALELLMARLDRAMNDPRFGDGRPMGGQLRFYVIAVQWADFEHRSNSGFYQEPRRILGWSRTEDVERLPALIAADAPRFEPPVSRAQVRCAVPLSQGSRAGQPCGAAPARVLQVFEADGSWQWAGWCARHRAAPEAVASAEHDPAGRPVPHPNVGGLLAAHLPAENWPEVYAAARPGWSPPPWGVNADEWPWVTSPPEDSRRGLRLLRGTGEDPERGDPPVLRLLR